MAMLTLTSLAKSYGDAIAVDGVSLTAEAGQILGVLGPNGAGKTTTVHMICGAIEPDSGAIDIAGIGGPASPSARARLGLAPQSSALYSELTGEENLAFFGALYGLSRSISRRRAREALARVGLSDRAGDRVEGYSGGMQRRLSLAAALLHEPDVLLLDEPTAGVDPQSRNAILDIARASAAEGRALVYSTHLMDEAQRLCDRVAIFDHGRVKALGSVDALIEEHGGPAQLVIEPEGDAASEVRIETDDPLAELNRAARERAIRRFRVERPSLEQVFLNLTGRALRD